MPDPLTTNMQFSVPVRGSDVGTWDVPLNGDWNITDAAFGGVTAIGLTNVNVNLSISQAQSAVLRFSGTLSGNVIVMLPSIVKFWTIQNVTTGSFVVTLTTGAGKVIGIPPSEPVDVFSDGTDLYFKNLDRIGAYLDYAGNSMPAWINACTVAPYLFCGGGTFSAITYPALSTILGGTTLPDLRGRARFSLNSGAGRITTAGSGIDGDTIFSAGGSEAVTLNTTQIPAHSHNGTTGGQSADHTHGISNVININGPFTSQLGNTGSQTSNTTVTTGGTSNDHVHNFTSNNTGGGLLHQNMPPTQISGITMIRAA